MAFGNRVIGGIKANRVISGVQERILLAQKRRIIGQSLSFRERRIEESIMGLYPVEYDSSATDDTIPIYYGKKITVSEIPQQVCEGLKEDPSLQATLDEVGGIISFNNGGEDGACKEENNEFFVLFGGRSEGKCRGRDNGCLECNEATGEWVIDEAMDGEPIDICHICSNGNIVAKEKGRVMPCNGNACCTMFEACDETLGCVTRCPANSSVDYVAGNQIGDSECYCNEGYRVDAFQTGCRSEKICEEPCGTQQECDDGQCVCIEGFVFSAEGECVDPACLDVTCEDGLTCVNGSCLCSDGMLPCKGACCEEGKICTAPGTGDSSTVGECVTPTGKCVTNANCGKDEFCLFTSYTSATDAETTCSVPKNGVCTPLTGDYAPQVVENTEEPLYGLTYSDAAMNWWSASNWCQANKSSLMTLATLNTLSGGDSLAARKTALQGGLGKTSSYVWLEDAISTSCGAFGVYLPHGNVGSVSREGSRYALCW